MPRKPATHAGFVAIVGAPNAGKSTLLNRLVGQKVSIVSPKPQTTRMRVLGVLTEDQTQVAFIDTPGIFTPKRRLDRAMVQAAWQSLEGADVIVLLVDAGAKDLAMTEDILAALAEKKQRVTLALNKTDSIKVSALLPITAKLNENGIITDTFMISALTGDGVDELKTHLKNRMKKGPWFFPEDQLSDLPQRLLAAEATREQLYRQLQQELPYAATVVPDTWETKKDGSAVIRQTIIVARESHRPIVLGKGGARIKEIGQRARKDIEALLGHKVHLFLEVKVDEKWQDRPEFYKSVGLEFE
ncbi:MAG: GTPase Era [Bdellovibrionales bacterium]